MNTFNNTNPSYKLYKKHKNRIDTSKTLLFSRLNSINPKIGKEIEKMYNERKLTHPLPYLGELYPWVISDIFELENDEQIQAISENWLALYYYTIFTDDVIDSKELRFEGKELISLTALLKEGLFKLFKTVIGTKYEEDFDQSINSVLNHGKIEEQINSIVSDDITVKVNYSSKKNDLLKLCAYAIASKCSKSEALDKTILSFTSNLQLSFQYLDDIADLKEDLRDKNYTVILNQLFKTLEISDVNQDNLLELLIEKKILLGFVNKIKSLLQEVDSSIPLTRENESSRFFKSIYDEVNNFHTLLEDIDYDLFCIQKSAYRNNIIVDVEKHISIVASSS
jgi:hypothetical protein